MESVNKKFNLSTLVQYIWQFTVTVVKEVNQYLTLYNLHCTVQGQASKKKQASPGLSWATVYAAVKQMSCGKSVYKTLYVQPSRLASLALRAKLPDKEKHRLA